jgi:hypothetical protein
VPITYFYFGLEPPANLTAVFATNFARTPLPAGATVRALVNLPRAQALRKTFPQLDLTQPIEALALRPIASHREVRLYDAGDGARLWEALRAADRATAAAPASAGATPR